MVVRNDKKSVAIIIEEWKFLILKLDEANRMENIVKRTAEESKGTARESIKLGKKLNKTVDRLLSTEEGISALILCMDDKTPKIQFMAARTLYPLYPQRTMKIMEGYEKIVTDGLEKMRIESVIRGFKDKQKVFVDQFKKMYNCEDLDSLNREK